MLDGTNSELNTARPDPQAPDAAANVNVNVDGESDAMMSIPDTVDPEPDVDGAATRGEMSSSGAESDGQLPLRQEYDFADVVDVARQQPGAGGCPRVIADDELDEVLHGGLEGYLTLFFGTSELAQKDDTVQPKASSWAPCIFSSSCPTMGCTPLPKGSAVDQKEARLSLFYAILYALLTHLLSTHSEKRQIIRTVRFRMSTVCVEQNEMQMFLRRTEKQEQEQENRDGRPRLGEDK